MHGFPFQDSRHHLQVHHRGIGATPDADLINGQSGHIAHPNNVVRAVGTGDQRLQLGQVEVNHPLVLGVRVCAERSPVLLAPLRC